MVNDYHFFLLPTFLRHKNPGVRIAYFFHTPWPSSECVAQSICVSVHVMRHEKQSTPHIHSQDTNTHSYITPHPLTLRCRIYRTLPWRTEILRGMLNCDFVQFQVFDYTRHFLVCCNRLLGLETTPTGVEYYGRTVKVRGARAHTHTHLDANILSPPPHRLTFTAPQVLSSHIGITPQVIRLHSGSDAATSTDSQWRQSLNGRKLFLGIDNLDALAGIALKMLAFEQFLASNAAMHGKVRPLL